MTKFAPPDDTSDMSRKFWSIACSVADPKSKGGGGVCFGLFVSAIKGLLAGFLSPQLMIPIVSCFLKKPSDLPDVFL